MTSQVFLASGGNMAEALYNTLIGMGTVFSVLIFISLIISCFEFIPAIQEKLAKKNKTEEIITETKTEEVAIKTAPATDELELVAVISAAIAAYTGMDQSDFVVRSIRRSPANKWIQ